MADRKLTIKLIGDSSQLERVFGRSASAAQGMGGKIRSVFGSVGKAAGIMGVAIGAAFAVGIGAAKNLADAASNLWEAQTKTNVIFDDGNAAVDAFAASAARTAGLSRRAALDIGSSFGAMFKPFTEGEDQLAEMSLNMTQLAGDLASFYNLESEDVAQKLFSGLSGEIRPLRDVNVFIDAKAVEAKAAAMGFEERPDGGGFSDQAKMQARYALIMEQTVDAQGDFIRTSDGMANSQRTLNATWENARATLGVALMPIFAKVMGFISDKLPGAIDKVIPFFERLVAGTINWVRAMQVRLMPTVDAVVSFVKGKWPEISAVVARGVELYVAAIHKYIEIGKQIVAWTKANWPEIQATIVLVFERVKEVVMAVVEFVAAFWNRFGDEILRVARILWDTVVVVFDKGMKIITGLLNAFSALFDGDWARLWETVKGVLGNAWDLIVGVVAGAFKLVVTILHDALNDAGNAVGRKVGEIVNWFIGLPGRIVGAIGDLAGTLLQKGKDIIGGLWDGVKSIFGQGEGNDGTVLGYFKNLPWKLLTAVGTGGLGLLYSFGVDIIQGLWNGALSLVTGFLGFIGGIPGAIADVFSDGTGKQMVKSRSADGTSTSARKPVQTAVMTQGLRGVTINQNISSPNPSDAAAAVNESIRREGSFGFGVQIVNHGG